MFRQHSCPEWLYGILLVILPREWRWFWLEAGSSDQGVNCVSHVRGYSTVISDYKPPPVHFEKKNTYINISGIIYFYFQLKHRFNSQEIQVAALINMNRIELYEVMKRTCVQSYGAFYHM